MENVSLLLEVFDNDEYLERVSSFSFIEIPEEIALLEFKFKKSFIYISIDENYDTLQVDHQIYNKETYMPRRDISGSVVWRDIIGKHIHWFWILTNNQGYNDGIQFQFRDENHKIYKTIQLMGLTSSIRIYEVNEK